MNREKEKPYQYFQDFVVDDLGTIPARRVPISRNGIQSTRPGLNSAQNCVVSGGMEPIFREVFSGIIYIFSFLFLVFYRP
jgi:hypothetical protein